MGLKIVNDYPPNIKSIASVFPKALTIPGVMWTYGSCLYAPGLPYVDPPLMAHEELHSRRHGDDPAGWWRQYLDSADFRFEEERLAYIEQYRVVRETITSRAERRHYLRRIAKALSGPLYNHLCTFAEAKRIITGGQE